MLEYVEERLRSLWRAKGNVALVDLSHGYFVIRFNQEEDMMDEGLDRGTMENKHQYLVLNLKGGHRRPETAVLHKAPVWRIFPGLPVNKGDRIFFILWLVEWGGRSN